MVFHREDWFWYRIRGLRSSIAGISSGGSAQDSRVTRDSEPFCLFYSIKYIKINNVLSRTYLGIPPPPKSRCSLAIDEKKAFGSPQFQCRSASPIFRSRVPPPVWRHRGFQWSPLDKVLWISRPAVPWGVFYRTTPGLAQKVEILITCIRYHLWKEIGWDL